MNNRLTFLLAILAVIIGATWLVMRPTPHRIAVGNRAPDFTATDIRTGKAASLYRDYRGTVTLVNVWATWCGPCRQEMPAMDSLFRALGPRGFRIAAVSIDSDSVAVVRKFVQDYHLSFDVLHDPKGTIEGIYQTTGYPESFLVDRTGQIIRIAMLATPWNSAENRRIIEELLAAPAN
jgi:cytochrome c biogenesis protein CcmG/thiol:disulfide interchange protein DsbE